MRMKKYLLSLCLVSFFVHSEDVKPFSDSEAVEYLTPSNNLFFANIVYVMVKNDAEASLQNNVTGWGVKLTPLSVATIAKEFDKNEITATDKYKNKTVRIKGRVRSIGLDALGGGVITVYGGGSFSGNLVASVNKEAGWVKEISKGDKVDLICKISGYVMLNVAAMCENSLIYTQALVKKEYGLQDVFSLPRNKFLAIFAYKIKSNEKEIAESCSKSDDNCFKTIMNVMDKTKKPDPRFVAWMSKLPE